MSEFLGHAPRHGDRQVIHRRGPWRPFDAVEFSTLEWRTGSDRQGAQDGRVVLNKNSLRKNGGVHARANTQRKDRGCTHLKVPGRLRKSASSCDARHMLRDAISHSLQQFEGWEAIMRYSSITRLIMGTAVAAGMSVVAISAIGGAVAQSSGQPRQETLTNHSTFPIAETEFRLSDRQQLKGYFLDGPRK